jgi:hypothetical protein
MRKGVAFTAPLLSGNTPNEIPRVVLHENPKRLGTHPQFQSVPQRARGKYVKFLCADDMLDAQCVERMVVAFEA